MMAEQGHGQYASQRRATQNHRRAPCCAPAASAGHHDRTHGEALGNLVQENRKENQPSQPVRYQKSRRDGNAVKEGMNDESEQHGISLVRMDEFVVMRLFAEMKMRCYRMLEEVDDQVAEKHQKRRRPAVKLKAFWNHLDQGGGQHEPSAQRDKVTQIAALPMPLHNDRSAENVGGSCGQAEKYAGGNGMHLLRDDTSSQFSVLSSQFSVLSSQFSVLSSQFSVLSSQFSVLSSQFSVPMRTSIVRMHHSGNSTINLGVRCSSVTATAESVCDH